MSGFPIVDLVVGMIFIYFLLSIISSSFVEIILSSFKIRSHVLGKWLLAIFDKKMMQPDGNMLPLGRAIMDHCATTALAQKGKSTSFMDAKNFVSSLIEKLTFDPEHPDAKTFDVNTPADQYLDNIIAYIEKAKAVDGTPMLSTELQRTFLMYAYEAKANYAASLKNTQAETPIVSELHIFRDKLEKWFDTSMDRIQGHMKTKYVRPITFIVGLIVAVGLNADSIAISRYLYRSPDASAKLSAQAFKYVQDQKIADSAAVAQKKTTKEVVDSAEQRQLNKAFATLKETDIPLGWQDSEESMTPKAILTKISGLLATVLAIMLGAPFWFDLLNKIANIRSSGTKPASSTDKDSK